MQRKLIVELGPVLGRGNFGVVYSGIITAGILESGLECAVKRLYHVEKFSKENSQYLLASDLGIGPRYYGTTELGGNDIGIVVEKIPYNFTPNNLEYIPPLLQLLTAISKTGYFCADFHCRNIMVTLQGELRLIDPSLVSTARFISQQVSKGKLGEEFLNSSDEELANYALGFMVDYITHPSFGGIPLCSHPEYREALSQFMSGRNTLRFLFTTGGWDHKEWEAIIPARID